jgi:hypothetical protein
LLVDSHQPKSRTVHQLDISELWTGIVTLVSPVSKLEGSRIFNVFDLTKYIIPFFSNDKC